MAKTQPQQSPPLEGMAFTEGDAGQSEPLEISEVKAAMASTESSEASPTMLPPNETEEAITAWVNNRRITALWGINQVRNTWVHVEGVGWKKLANQSDSGIVALNLLSSHARQLNSVVNYREEADGMIYEMYVW